jgi:hypothetical protein
MFVNVSHPSELFGKSLQKQIRSFTATQNESKKRKKRLKLKHESSLSAKNALVPCKTESPPTALLHIPPIHLLKSNTKEPDFKIFRALRLKLCVDVPYPEQALRALEYRTFCHDLCCSLLTIFRSKRARPPWSMDRLKHLLPKMLVRPLQA